MKLAHVHNSAVTGQLNFLDGDYVMEDDSALRWEMEGACTLEPVGGEELKPLHEAMDMDGKRILFVRSGGLGDLLFMTPTVAEIKRRWPNAKVDVCAHRANLPVFQENPDVYRMINYPPSLNAFRRYDAHVWLEGFIEKDPAAKTVHAVDLVAAKAGLTLDDKRIRYFPTNEELATAKTAYPRSEKRRVGIQVLASALCRSYPPSLTVNLIRLLLSQGWEVFIFGAPGSVPIDSRAGLVNLTLVKPAPGIRESAAIMATCDGMIAPDSALCHLAGAMELPTVALYGPFKWQLRTAYAPSIFALNGHGPCAPCFHHQKADEPIFPAFGPCAKSKQCDVLATISPEQITARLSKITSERTSRPKSAAAA